MRRLTYLVACTVDRFIALEDGSFDCFLMEGPHIDDLVSSFPDTIPGHLREALGVENGNKRFDTVLMGRGTYEVGLGEGVTSPYPHLRQFVFSRQMETSLHEDVTLVSTDPLGFVRELKKEDGMDIWLCGGGKLASALLLEIDMIILKVHPVLIGAGIPLFHGPYTQESLSLTALKTYDNGVALMQYELKRAGQ